MVRVAFMFLGYKGTNSLTIELYNTYYGKKDDKKDGFGTSLLWSFKLY